MVTSSNIIILGYLRACTYCCRIVIGYLESLDLAPDLTVCLKQLQESVENKSNLQSDIATNLVQNKLSPVGSMDSLEVGGTLRRKVSVGYQEEKFAPGRYVANKFNYIPCHFLVPSLYGHD